MTESLCYASKTQYCKSTILQLKNKSKINRKGKKGLGTI